MRLHVVIMCLASLAAAACGDDDAGESKDVVATETTATTDTSVAETAADTSVPPTDTEPADTGPADTGPADTGAETTGTEVEPEEVTEGPEHLEVFFASVMSFDNGLAASQFDGGLSTKIVGTGEQGTLTVQFSGVTTGTYDCGPSITNVMWQRTSGATEHTDAAQGGSCTIVVTKYQAGGRIEGTFSGVMAAPPPDIGIPFNEGSFSVFIQ